MTVPGPGPGRRNKPPTKEPKSSSFPPAPLPKEVAVLVSDVVPIPAPQPDSKNVFYRGVWSADGIPVMVKGFESTPPDQHDIWAAWRDADSPYIARLRCTFPPDPGRHAGVMNFEVTDYHELGSIADLYGGRSAPPEEARQVLEQLATALDHLHAGDATAGRPGLTHGDIKPGNILVRSREPRLELCLTDFGSARLNETRDEDVPVKMTVAYAAPEAQRELAPAADWWSVGITMLELVQGHHPFMFNSGAWQPDLQIRRLIHRKKVPIDRTVPDRWENLFRGLLSFKPGSRWGAREVRDWLNGENPPIDDSIDVTGVAEEPFVFDGIGYTEPALLAAAMSARWDATTRLIGGVREWQALLRWIRPFSDSMRERLESADRLGGESEQIDLMIAEVVAALAPHAVPVFRGWPVDVDGLLTLVRQQERGDPAAIDVLVALRRSGALAAYGRYTRLTTLHDTNGWWQRWYQLAHAAAVHGFGGEANLPNHNRLPGMLLHARLDDSYRESLRERYESIVSGRRARHSGVLSRIEEAARMEHAGDDVPVHAVVVLAEPILRNPPPRQSAGVPSAGPEEPFQPATTGGGRFVSWMPVSIRRPMAWLRHPAERSALALPVTRLPYLHPRRTTRQRVWLAARLTAVLAGTVVLAGVPGLAVAETTSRLDGTLVATAIALGGGCLLLAVVLRRSRLTSTLIGAWAGVLLGACIAFVAGGTLTVLLGPGTGWPVFWISWMVVAMTLTARGAVR